MISGLRLSALVAAATAVTVVTGFEQAPMLRGNEAQDIIEALRASPRENCQKNDCMNGCLFDAAGDNSWDVCLTDVNYKTCWARYRENKDHFFCHEKKNDDKHESARKACKNCQNGCLYDAEGDNSWDQCLTDVGHKECWTRYLKKKDHYFCHVKKEDVVSEEESTVMRVNARQYCKERKCMNGCLYDSEGDNTWDQCLTDVSIKDCWARYKENKDHFFCHEKKNDDKHNNARKACKTCQNGCLYDSEGDNSWDQCLTDVGHKECWGRYKENKDHFFCHVKKDTASENKNPWHTRVNARQYCKERNCMNGCLYDSEGDKTWDQCLTDVSIKDCWARYKENKDHYFCHERKNDDKHKNARKACKSCQNGCLYDSEGDNSWDQCLTDVDYKECWGRYKENQDHYFCHVKKN